MNLPVRGSQSPANPMASLWLKNAASHLGLSPLVAQNFGYSGLLNLPGLTIQLQPWRDTPEPQWFALAFLPRPNNVSPALWNELLLRSNCAVSAIGTCTAALDERGNGLLVSRLCVQPYSDTAQLGEALAVMIALAESLIAGSTTLSTDTSRVNIPNENPSFTSGIQLSSSKATIVHQWHRPLLVIALHHLGNETPEKSIDAIALIRIGKKYLEIIADSDERHLLVSTVINQPLRSSNQRTLALRANLELMALTGCSVALAPEGACLQARWDSKGLDGIALGNWLGDFAHLAGAMGNTPSPSSACRSRL